MRKIVERGAQVNTESALTHQPVQRLSIQPGDPFYETMNGAMETIP